MMSTTKSVALVQCLPQMIDVEVAAFQPFILSGFASLTGSDLKPVSILKDTGSAQSFILSSILPFSTNSYAGTDVLVRGIEMACINVPLHHVNLKSDLINGPVKLGVCEPLPVSGVDLILGNDLAGGEVFPPSVIPCNISVGEQPDLPCHFPEFPPGIKMPLQSEELGEVFGFSEECMFPMTKPVEGQLSVKPELCAETVVVPALTLEVSWDLPKTQELDPPKVNYVKVDFESTKVSNVLGSCKKGLVMRNWKRMFSQCFLLSPVAVGCYRVLYACVIGIRALVRGFLLLLLLLMYLVLTENVLNVMSVNLQSIIFVSSLFLIAFCHLCEWWMLAQHVWKQCYVDTSTLAPCQYASVITNIYYTYWTIQNEDIWVLNASFACLHPVGCKL